VYDYIVIGAGSAGCVIASRLTEDPARNVLLIEAGPPDRRREIRIPAAFSKLFKSELDWNYRTEPQEHLNGRSLYWPRGKVLGGCSSMNAMVYIRGNRADFDCWRDLGNTGWGFDDVLPHFEAAEKQLSICALRDVNPLSRAFVESCSECGIAANDDFNGPEQEGAGFFRVTQKRGRRFSAADAYLRPALNRGNLTVWAGVQVTRMVIENGRAIGVDYVQNGATGRVRAVKEVVLSAGAIGSPHLLLLSGIGPQDQLEAVGIDTAVNLPGVGANLQDHLAVMVGYQCTQPVSLHDAERLPNLLKYFVGRRGPLTSNVAEACAFSGGLQFHFGPVHYVEHGFVKPGGHGFSIGPTLISPRSRGSIFLKSANPFEPPGIDPWYLSDPSDLESLAKGVLQAYKIAEAKPFAPYRGDPVLRLDDPEEYVRSRAETLYHPVGTCAMGLVVGTNLQVLGVSGLRVVDASVMPVIVRGNTQAATMMIAEKAARLIAG
jgi:choline dehydrogenase